MDKEIAKKKQPLPFGKKVKAIRKKKGISQIELAEKLGVTQRVISYYENESKNPSLDLVSKIAKGLGVSNKKLLEYEEDVPESTSPIRSLQKRIPVMSKLPANDQKYIAQTIDMLAERNGITKGKSK